MAFSLGMTKISTRRAALLALVIIIGGGCDRGAAPVTNAPERDPASAPAAGPAEPAAAPQGPALAGAMPTLTLESGDKAAIEPKLREWLESLDAPLELTISGGALAYNDNTKNHRLEHEGWALFVGFLGGVASSADAEGVQAKFRFWGIDREPLPIRAPGWSFILQTPRSSFDSDFRVTSFAGGELRAEITGEFFALHGTKDAPECVTPADASTPEPCFISIRRTIPFTLRVAAALRD